MTVPRGDIKILPTGLPDRFQALRHFISLGMSEEDATAPQCPQCGAELLQSGSVGRRRVYCTPECRKQFQQTKRNPAPPAPTFRRSPTTVDVEYSDEEREVLREVERYRQRHGYRVLTVCEILRVLLAMGYARAK